MTLCGSVLEGYDSASAPLEPEEDARLSTLPFSPPHAAVPPIPPPSILLAHSLPLSLRRVVSTLSPSRSIAFYVVFTLVSLFFRFSQLSPRLPPPPLSHPFSSLSPLEIFPSRLHARVVRRLPRFRTRLSTRRLFRGSVSATSFPYLPFSPAPRDALTSSLPFDHNSRLTNIVSTLGAFGGKFGPGASRKVPL